MPVAATPLYLRQMASNGWRDTVSQTVRQRTERVVPVPQVAAALFAHHMRRKARKAGLNPLPPYRPTAQNWS